MDNLIYMFVFIIMIGVVFVAAYYGVLKPRGITFGGSSSKVKSGFCPFCGSDDIFYSPKRNLWSCNKPGCREIFREPSKLGR